MFSIFFESNYKFFRDFIDISLINIFRCQVRQQIELSYFNNLSAHKELVNILSRGRRGNRLLKAVEMNGSACPTTSTPERIDESECRVYIHYSFSRLPRYSALTDQTVENFRCSRFLSPQNGWRLRSGTPKARI